MDGIREHLIQEFLAENGWGKAAREKLACDASFRSYERLSNGEKTVMLMDAPPEKEDIQPFINIDRFLRRCGFSAPQIYATDEKNGFILLEDLGNNSYSAVLAGKSSISGIYGEEELYMAAMDVLIQLSRSTMPEKIPDYGYSRLLQECRLLVDWYLPNIKFTGNLEEASEEYIEIWKGLVDFDKIAEDTVVLRDYHADNLMWLPERTGVERVGLLDFQDAVTGSPVYDIVSLFEDARRDVQEGTVEKCIKHYLKHRKTIDKRAFMRAYAVLAAQRNCKIIGIFARLAVRDGKERYINYIPRVWGHLEKDMLHSSLKPLKKWFGKYMADGAGSCNGFIVPKKESQNAE